MQHTDATTNKRCGKKNRLTSLTDERKIHQQSNESKELIMCKKSSQFKRQPSQVTLSTIPVRNIIWMFYGLNHEPTLDMDVSMPTKKAYLQRGLEWELEKKVAFIKTMMAGGFTQAISLNNLTRDNIVKVIDGKQRINTVISYYQNEFAVDGVYYRDLSDDDKYIFESFLIPAYQYTSVTPLSDDELIKWFLAINDAGKTVQQAHLATIRALCN